MSQRGVSKGPTLDTIKDDDKEDGGKFSVLWGAASPGGGIEVAAEVGPQVARRGVAEDEPLRLAAAARVNVHLGRRIER